MESKKITKKNNKNQKTKKNKKTIKENHKTQMGGVNFVNNVDDTPWYTSRKKNFIEKIIKKSMELADNYIPEKKEGEKKYRKNAKKRINEFITQNKEKLKENYEDIRTYDFAKFIARRFMEHMDEHIKKKPNNTNLQQEIIYDIKKLVEDILTKNKIQELIDNHIKNKIIGYSSNSSRRW